MKIGISAMNTPEGLRPDLLAREVEARGLESLWFGEHSHIPVNGPPYPGGGPLPEPYKRMQDLFVSLTAAAMATTVLRLGSSVALPLERDVFNMAKAVATLDLLSGGRVLMGVGVGWNAAELANHSPVPWPQRYRALRETVAALRALWREDQPSFHGEHVRFDAVWSYPKPVQPGGPPILLGAARKLGVAHAAEWADGWMPIDVEYPDFSKGMARIAEACRAAGRDPAALPVTVVCFRRASADSLARLRDLGVARAICALGIDHDPGPDEARRELDRLAALKDGL
jgi:probable F420-dependent oxidoreductase